MVFATFRNELEIGLSYILLRPLGLSLGPLERGSTIGFAGCGIWLFFVVIRGMRAENRSGMWEF